MIAFKTFLAMAVENDVQEKGKGLWHNIHQKRKRGERMRKKGEKGAPTAAAMKSASEGKGSKPEPFEVGFKRRVVKTTDPEHKEKGFNWRIKGKKKDNLTIKLYKNKPDYKEFVKQMRRVAGHEFG